jgi:TolA-binding protein
MAEGRTGGDSYTPTEAALILRVTPTRVRQLLQDDELEGERDEAGHWLIPARAVHERVQRLRRELLEAKEETIAELRDRVASLERRLEAETAARERAEEAERAANRENRRLLAAALERIPAIEAPQEPREQPETDAEPTEGPSPRSNTGGASGGRTGARRDGAQAVVG